jgi:hypothetical protein
MHGLLESIGGTTLVKWCPSLLTPAPIHTTTISSFRATIMSTSPSVPKNSSAGAYCSARAVRNTVLSRRPTSTSRPSASSESAGLTRSGAAPGSAPADPSADPAGRTTSASSEATKPRYSATSKPVRVSPSVNGTAFQGRRRIVPGRA